jgi:hypothetical protein
LKKGKKRVLLDDISGIVRPGQVRRRKEGGRRRRKGGRAGREGKEEGVYILPHLVDR